MEANDFNKPFQEAMTEWRWGFGWGDDTFEKKIRSMLNLVMIAALNRMDEWGNGKTSLINSIHHAFESDERIKQIWINSWEYSLLSTPEEALLKIVNRIIEELVDADPDKARVE